MNLPAIDSGYLRQVLSELLAVPSPTGRTGELAQLLCGRLATLGIACETDRRGSVSATFLGALATRSQAVTAHLDTLGAMVSACKPNGRLALTPLGSWSSRFAEGARVTLFTDQQELRGTILPLLASGHAYSKAVDSQGVSWDQVELRVDLPLQSVDDLRSHGINVGDIVAIDAVPEWADNGYVNARHLDDKAGVAAILAALEAITRAELQPALSTQLVFTVTEEIGFGAAGVLDDNVRDMVNVDIAIVAPEQASTEHAVTVAMKDTSVPYDRELTQKLLTLCRAHGIAHRRDVFRYYHSDARSALLAGHDVRVALIGFGADASHGYERTHTDSLLATAQLVTAYLLGT